jgi:para-nitrobenzyl esterase
MKNFKFLLIAAALMTAPAIAQKSSAPATPIVAGTSVPTVQTEFGKVRGYIHNGTHTYKGIPYAKAERFMPPSKPDSWKDVRSSMTYGPVCPLVDPTTSVNDPSEFAFHHDWGYPNEDCLRLNIWTPGVNDGKKRPVMVWLHGGGYSAGSSQELPSYDGENISKKGDVVLVSVNHRLNVLGFLDLSKFGDKYKNSGNVGMMDIVSALEFVKNNISAFGGDPNNVTIFGQSGGGGKVTTLMNAPSAKGLFHKAIVQSGATARFQEPEITTRVGVAVVQALGLTNANVDSIQKVPYAQLAAASKKALQKVREQLTAEGKTISGFGFGWSPVRDGVFLPYQPTEPAALALSATVPLMIGSTKNEFITSLWGNPQLKNGTVDDMKAFLQKRFGDKTEAYIAAVKKAYPNDTKPTDLVDVDDRFRAGTVNQANLKSSTKTAPVYMYLFSWQSPVMDGDMKALHCMELPFVFNNIARCEEMTGGGKDAYALADKMSQAWINFARTGNPNHKGLPEWPAYTEANGATMFFDNQCLIRNSPDKELLAVVSSVAN